MAKLVYIAHAVAGDVEANVKDILRICKEVHTKDVVPFAPYLVALQYLHDHLEEERALGIATNIECFQRRVMDEVWLTGPNISRGMQEEIKLARKYNIPVVCYNPALQIELEKLIEYS